jgi:hypothetical protein
VLAPIEAQTEAADGPVESPAVVEPPQELEPPEIAEPPGAEASSVQYAAPSPVVVATGEFLVTGNAHAVRLAASDRHWSPGSVPPGAYTIQAQFAEEGTWTNAGALTVVRSAVHTVDCQAAFERCKTR